MRANISKLSQDRSIAKRGPFRFFILFFVVTLFYIYKINKGIPSFDEALYISLPWRFLNGDFMFQDELIGMQMSSFLLLPFMKLFLMVRPNLDYVVLYFRFIYFCFQIAICLLSYWLLYKKEKNADIICILYYAFVPFGIMALSYTTIPLGLLFFSSVVEDMATLSLFKNLKSLNINISCSTTDFWSSFTHMEDLYMCLGDDFDFISFAKMQDLSSLFVSGGDCSKIDCLNLEALIPLKKLRNLQLHEFGCVDLLPLTAMPQLRELGVHYANKVHNIEIIGTLSHLEALKLTGLRVDSLNFLDQLPDHIRLEMCGNHVYGGVDPQKWKRFAKRDICEISVKDKPFEYIDLSALNG